MGGAVCAAQLSAERALQLPEVRVGQSRDAFQTENVSAGEVLRPAPPLLGVKHLEADFTFQQVDLDLPQGPLRTQTTSMQETPVHSSQNILQQIAQALPHPKNAKKGRFKPDDLGDMDEKDEEGSELQQFWALRPPGSRDIFSPNSRLSAALLWNKHENVAVQISQSTFKDLY